MGCDEVTEQTTQVPESGTREREKRVSSDIKGKNKIEDTMRTENKHRNWQEKRGKKAHLSPHNGHLSLKHRLVKAFIRLERKRISCVSKCPVSLHITLLPGSRLFTWLIDFNLHKQRKKVKCRRLMRCLVPWTSRRGPHRGPGQSSCQRGGTAPGLWSPGRRPP